MKKLKYDKLILKPQIKANEEDDSRVLRFIGTDETKDRYDEVMTMSGWDFKNYKKNPVFLWAHRSMDPPIGKAIKIESDKEKGFIFDVEFADRETYAFADTVYKLYKGGFLSAVSVGFMPKEHKKDDKDETVYITKKELLELSAVPVPANPNALQTNCFQEAVQKGVINEQEYQEFIIASKNFLEKYKEIVEDDSDSDEKPKDENEEINEDNENEENDNSSENEEEISEEIDDTNSDEEEPEGKPEWDKKDYTYTTINIGDKEFMLVPMDEKAGRVLSAENEKLIKSTVSSLESTIELLNDILAKVNKPQEEPEKSKLLTEDNIQEVKEFNNLYKDIFSSVSKSKKESLGNKEDDDIKAVLKTAKEKLCNSKSEE